MGSEHYCLRWNNHQSNLLGVFSQLLQDESLVDVTLSCSEGAPIRAHKVVLSACSSYFQSLFLDHPERHPIVILKDVRFSELQTLVEFMYKGEVNVQYCQLSALLKTAESLKVKGLAEMTNQNTSLREPEREPERLRTQPSKSTCDSPVDAALAGPSSTTSLASTPSSSSCSTGTTIAQTLVESNAATAASSSSVSTANLSAKIAPSTSSIGGHKRESSARCSSTPPKRVPVAIGTTASESRHSPLPLDLYRPRIDAEEASNIVGDRTHVASGTSSTEGVSNSNITHGNRSPTTSGGRDDISGTNRSSNVQQDHGDGLESPSSPKRSARPSAGGSAADADIMGVGSIEKIEEPDDYEEEMDLEEEDADADDNSSSNEVGLNMKISGCGVVGIMGHASMVAAISSPLDGGGGDVESARSTPAILTGLASDLTHRPASRSSRDGGASTARTPTERPSSSGVCGSLAATTGGLSPSSSTAHGGSGVGGNIESESLANTSGLGPVQSVPLSLKKEIECSEDDNSSSRHMQPRSASAGGGLGSELDYRASHESETSESPHPSGGGGVSANASSMGGAGSALEQPQTPPPIYPCVYCGAAFPNQSKLTRHILSHSLKTLEYRETATHALLHPHLLPHDLNMGPLPQQFAYQINALAASGADPQEQAAAVAAAAAAIEMDFAAAVAAAGGCALTGIGSSCGSSASRSGLDLDVGGGSSSGAGVGGGGSCSSGRGGSSRDNNGGLGSSSSSLLAGVGSSSSSSTSAAAAAAAAAAVAASTSAAAALLGSSPGSASTNDPNSVVLCKFCGKSFPDVASLITHLPVHTGDRPFKCEFCGKAFKLRHHMKDHCRVHTGERPFRCSMCGKTFSRSTILKAHEKTHFPKYVRKYLSPSPVDTKDELPQ